MFNAGYMIGNWAPAKFCQHNKDVVLTVNQVSIFSSIGTMFIVYYLNGIVAPATVNITKAYVLTINQVSIYSSIGTMFNVHYMKGYWVPVVVNVTKILGCGLSTK